MVPEVMVWPRKEVFSMKPLLQKYSRHSTQLIWSI